MKFLATALDLFLLTAPVTAQDTLTGTVTHVRDGDTIEVADVPVRLDALRPPKLTNHRDVNLLGILELTVLEYAFRYSPIGIGEGALSVSFAIPEFTDVFVPIGRCVGGKTVSPSRYVSISRTRRQSKTLCCTDQQDGKGQVDGCGQVSHRGMMAENLRHGEYLGKYENSSNPTGCSHHMLTGWQAISGTRQG